jgi:L-ribulose-5-phosphate 3-epimerase
MGDVLRNDLPGAVAVLRGHGVRFGYENHPERSPQEVLALIGDAADVLGAAVDTGWWATQGYDPVQALRDLDGRLFHVHLKDVEEPGTHISCMHGEGCAGIAGCVDELLALGYQGALTVEHEPFDRDPTEEVIRMRELIEARLAEAQEAPHV